MHLEGLTRVVHDAAFFIFVFFFIAIFLAYSPFNVATQDLAGLSTRS
jgi:hypothetical protein